MSRYRVSSNALALLACTALLLASFGCSSTDSLTAPDSTPYVVDNPNFVRILSASDGAPVYSMDSAPVAAVISAEHGGSLSNGRVTLEFPPAALDTDTEITIEMLNDGTLGVELSPHGIQFNHPVTLSMDLTGTSAEGQATNVTTLYYNEDQNQYETVPTLPSDSNTTSCSLEHFSRYHDSVGG